MLTCKHYDNAIRWQEGERLADLFERRCDQLTAAGKKNHPAIVNENTVITYTELDKLANQAARYLLTHGIAPGDRVGLLFDNSIHTYIALLAVVKINAAYVPLDPSFPNDRIGFIIKDANIKTLVTLSNFRFQLRQFAIPQLFLDLEKDNIAKQRDSRLTESETGPHNERLCYIIYTSGSTGRPKGVAVEHPSICNFVEVAREVYGLNEADRVYQGMTIAFDFSVEELWVPLMAGATLVPAPADTKLVGKDLHEFLLKNRITALCCVPTLLATLDEDLPALRFLLVSGEACPHDLVVRWYRPDRTIINAYGPTEATVTATAIKLHPDKPVTIGQPLPTYSIVILDAHKNQAVPQGELGEICIAGIGLAKGYVNLEELTNKRFIQDFLAIGNNPSGRIYRTGDLGRINAEGEIEYHGRIDAQVKIRGYRIELTEIESVLLQLPNIAQAVVNVYEPEPGIKELAAYYTLKDATHKALSDSEISQALRSQLPAYMVPAFYQRLENIPMLPSNKADRKQLPAPEGPRLAAPHSTYAAPRNALEKTIAKTLADVLRLEQISINDDFFSGLGAHSLLMARFCAALREQSSTSISMRDVYLNPTTAKLAEYLQGSQSAKSTCEVESRQAPDIRIASNLEYFSCGALQLVFYSILFYFNYYLVIFGISWITTAATPTEFYLRTCFFTISVFCVYSVLPVAIKWLIIGRWKPEVIPIWSLRYFRFWAVKQLIQSSPLAMFKGLPIFNFYLRLLGAKIGRSVVIESKSIPVCADLLTIGDNAVLRKDSILLGYKAVSNYIYTGAVTIGKNTFVGEASVLDIDTVMEDGTQLGHCSSLHAGQTLYAGKHYHGSPAIETNADYCSIEAKNCTRLRKAVYSAMQLCNLFFVAPAGILAFYYLLLFVYQNYIGLPFNTVVSTRLIFSSLYEVFLFSGYTFIASIVFGLVAIAILPRVLSLLIKEERLYVLYGFHYWLFKMIQRISNLVFYNRLFGDSSFIVYYLRLIGYNLCRVIQTGSNFGVEHKHDSPLLCRIGTNTMVSDGLSMINARISSTSFKLSKVTIGENNFLGNDIHYPANSKTGENCLLATKVMVPIDGPVRENTGLLGSPCFEIPRATNRDKYVAQLDDHTQKKRLRFKNIHNLVTATSFLTILWIYLSISLVLISVVGAVYIHYGFIAGAAILAFWPLFTIAYFVLVERLSIGFGKLKPQTVSIYDKRYWQVEHYWKHMGEIVDNVFKGTPFRNVILRLLGVKIGKKVFNDGVGISERTLVEIGNYCTLNAHCFLQSHSLEEGVFKSDHIKIGKGCTIGVNAFVHYGVSTHENVIIDADAFVMKGEVAASNTRWRGNPAIVV